MPSVLTQYTEDFVDPGLYHGKKKSLFFRNKILALRPFAYQRSDFNQVIQRGVHELFNGFAISCIFNFLAALFLDSIAETLS